MYWPKRQQYIDVQKNHENQYQHVVIKTYTANFLQTLPILITFNGFVSASFRNDRNNNYKTVYLWAYHIINNNIVNNSIIKLTKICLSYVTL